MEAHHGVGVRDVEILIYERHAKRRVEVLQKCGLCRNIGECNVAGVSIVPARHVDQDVGAEPFDGSFHLALMTNDLSIVGSLRARSTTANDSYAV